MGWEIYPDGLHHFLTWMHENYTKGLPLYITENSMANADEPGRPDRERIDYLNLHLAACKRAIADGVSLSGYTFCVITG